MNKFAQNNRVRMGLSVLTVVGWASAAAAQEVSSSGATLVRTDCSQEQNDRINGAIVEAGFMFIGAGNDLDNISKGGDTTLFVNWFGDASPDAISRVTNTLTGAYYALGDAGFDCGCNIPPFQKLFGNDETTIVAWTEHNDPHHLIHLCPLYFSLDFYEFAVGTLVHELTHFYGTNDVPEGASCADPDYLDPDAASYQLARSSPEKAIDNADNYRLYVLEWDPAQASSYMCQRPD
jgi:hypothetical protein